jgi:hypothetical protein
VNFIESNDLIHSDNLESLKFPIILSQSFAASKLINGEESSFSFGHLPSASPRSQSASSEDSSIGPASFASKSGNEIFSSKYPDTRGESSLWRYRSSSDYLSSWVILWIILSGLIFVVLCVVGFLIHFRRHS